MILLLVFYDFHIISCDFLFCFPLIPNDFLLIFLRFLIEGEDLPTVALEPAPAPSDLPALSDGPRVLVLAHLPTRNLRANLRATVCVRFEL